jgi:hypothetical protein
MPCGGIERRGNSMTPVIDDLRGSRAFIRSFNALGVFKPSAQKYFSFVFSEVVLMCRIPPRRRATVFFCGSAIGRPQGWRGRATAFGG